jgi:hypothetical protein
VFQVGTIYCSEVGEDSTQVSTLIIIYIGQGLDGCEPGNHSHYFQGVARCEPRHRLEA